MLTTTIRDTPVGDLTLVVSERGVRALLWGEELDKRFRAFIGADPADLEVVDEDGADGDLHPVLTMAVEQLREYFAGDRHDFDLPLDPIGTPFQQRAWHVLRAIPYGETISYGEQARRLGDEKLARAAGAANGRNPISIIVPCHRVVGSTGKLTGFGGGLGNKDWLLRHESNALFPA